MYRFVRANLALIPLSLLLFACASPETKPQTQPVIQTGPNAEVIDGNLHRVDNSAVAKSYVDPAFNIDDYEKILIEPLDVSNIAVIAPDYSRSETSWQLNDDDGSYLVQRYRTSMIKNFFALGGYVAATGPGDKVLRIRVALSQVGPEMPYGADAGSITTGQRSDPYSGGGEVRITGIVDDSGTGKTVARFFDIRQSSSNWALSDTLKNQDDAKNLFESWARLFVYRLQENRKKTRASGKVW